MRRSVDPPLKPKISQPAVSWPRAQAEGPSSGSVFYLWWVTQGQIGHLDHLDPTLSGFSTVTVWAAMKQGPLMFCCSLTSCREKRNWFSLAMFISQDISLMENQFFLWYRCHLLLRPGEKPGHLQPVPPALGFKWTVPTQWEAAKKVCLASFLSPAHRTHGQNWYSQKDITYGTNWLHKFGSFT